MILLDALQDGDGTDLCLQALEWHFLPLALRQTPQMQSLCASPTNWETLSF